MLADRHGIHKEEMTVDHSLLYNGILFSLPERSSITFVGSCFSFVKKIH